MQDNAEALKSLLLGNAEIEYSERGGGESIVLIHAGVFSDWFVPLAASDTLNDFHIVRVRRAGYGPKTPEGPLTIQDHANHVASLADRIGLKNLHLVGHSSGGLIALQLASEHPSSCRV
jgi:pimeloyl-ACP methyl ester carboxylesterase